MLRDTSLERKRGATKIFALDVAKLPVVTANIIPAGPE